MEIKVNQNDIQRILGKLKVAQDTIKARKNSIKFRWIVDILDRYTNVVQRAMGDVEMEGSVKARGGYLRIHFMGEDGSEYWKKLSLYTLAIKGKRKGIPPPKSKDDYEDYRARFTIWRDTGETRGAVINYLKMDNGESFAGIIRSRSPKAFKKALENELGTTRIPQRKLFTVANDLLIKALRKILQNPTDPKHKELRDEIIKDFFKGQLAQIKWGRRTGG